MRRFYCPALSLFPGQDNKKLLFSPFLNWPLKRAWREGNAQDASDDYSSGVVAGFKLATLIPETNLALISLAKYYTVEGNEIAERSRAELGAKAARKMRAVHSRKKKINDLGTSFLLIGGSPVGPESISQIAS